DRPAQLDLLLRSLVQSDVVNAFASGMVIYSGEHYEGSEGSYALLVPEKDFEAQVRALLRDANLLVTFMCDDGVLYRPLRATPALHVPDTVICVSLRLG